MSIYRMHKSNATIFIDVTIFHMRYVPNKSGLCVAAILDSSLPLTLDVSASFWPLEGAGELLVLPSEGVELCEVLLLEGGTDFLVEDLRGSGRFIGLFFGVESSGSRSLGSRSSSE